MRTFIENDQRAVDEAKMRLCCRRKAQYAPGNGDTWFCPKCSEAWRLAGTFREYDCGCCQQVEHLCKEAGKLEGAMHDAMSDAELMAEYAEDFDEERQERIARKERACTRAFYAHFEGRAFREVSEAVLYAKSLEMEGGE